MQNNIVKAFRQRLVRAGFQDIGIYDLGNGCYKVCVISSTGEYIRRNMTLLEMHNTPRTVWFD